jgi:uncharacterized lipoprotein
MTSVLVRIACMATFLPVAGCGWLPDAYSGCNDAKPYESAKQVDPLKVPAGADLPDTHNALKIPDVNTPELPDAEGSCLDHPPPYGKEHPDAKKS